MVWQVSSGLLWLATMGCDVIRRGRRVRASSGLVRVGWAGLVAMCFGRRGEVGCGAARRGSVWQVRYGGPW